MSLFSWLRPKGALLILPPVALALLLGAVDWRLWLRAATYPEEDATAVSWYRPLETVAGSVSPLPAAAPDISAEALEAAADYAAQQNSRALLVIHRGQVVFERYWHGFGPESVANGMSMTKTLVALLVGIAIDEGHIPSVQEPVATYLPEWSDRRGQLTVEDLLLMHSGLRNDDDTSDPFSDLVRMYLGSDVAATALQVPQLRPPGQYEYNNVNTQILSLVLERATGEPLQDYLTDRLWRPLGAGNGALWLDRPGGRVKAFCCFFATARDWGRVGLMMINRGQVGAQQVVPARWLERMGQPSPVEPTFGYHLWVKARTPEYTAVDTAASVPFVAADTVYLDGRGFQRVYGIPSRQLVIVRLGEQPEHWDDAVLPNILVQGIQE